jgi:glycine/D-amino acid oxidase-like deaminating enzyme/nitrite reductase/ring-hydroxylating ferredoxin subunit
MIYMNANISEFEARPNSYWIATAARTDYPSLEESVDVDVAIVGGGIVGITTAYLLKKAGRKVAVVEADRILHGTTGHTTAKITSQHSLSYAKLKKDMGDELARQYAEANESAIHLVASLVKENNINCDFKWQPAYIYTQAAKYIREIEEETRAAFSLGIKAEYLDKVPLPFTVEAAMRFDDQAQFHPLQFLQFLAKQIPGDGSHIFENSPAIDIEKDPARVVTRSGNKVRAEKVIIATHFPFFDGGGLYFSRIYTDRSYALAVKIQEQFPEGMYINAEEPNRSLRSLSGPEGNLVLVVGEKHKTGDGDNLNQHYQNLLDYAHSTFNVNEVKYRWSTQDCMTLDGIPYVGNLTPRNPDFYVATGFGKWGMSNGIASAMILSDLIVKGDHPWAPVYNPARFHLGTLKSFAVQNLDVAKELIAGKIEKNPDDVEVARGEARVINRNGQRCGVYRDEQDRLHYVDTTCTHLGCELMWNDAERTWDCPCHGSRFSYTGESIEGPAFNQLCPPRECTNQVEARVFK